MDKKYVNINPTEYGPISVDVPPSDLLNHKCLTWSIAG